MKSDGIVNALYTFARAGFLLRVYDELPLVYIVEVSGFTLDIYADSVMTFRCVSFLISGQDVRLNVSHEGCQISTLAW